MEPHNIQRHVGGFLRPNPPGNASYVPRSIQALQIVSKWQYAQIGGDNLWLRMEICIGFKQFLCMRLGNTPAVEMLPFTAESWVETIGEGMTEQLDRERIKSGFKQLYRTIKWWPQPAELLNALPRRTPPPSSPKVKAAEEPDIDTSADGERLQEILDLLNEKERKVNHG